MVNEIRVYYESDGRLREGWRAFFDSTLALARAKRTSMRFVGGGSKVETIRDFVTATRTQPTATIFLLIDPDFGGTTDELMTQTKASGHMDGLVGVADDNLHFMVQVMESWFLADVSALSRYYGTGFRERSLPANPNVEQVPKSDVERGISAATAGTAKRRYHKTRHAPTLLASIDPGLVRKAAPRCDRLFKALEDVPA